MKWKLTEDWTVVILGLGIILFALLGFTIASPTYSWSSFQDLSTKIFTSQNFSSVAQQFLLLFAVAILGSFLVGRKVKNTLILFPILFILTLLALIAAGNGVVKEYNLEAVIFSLLVGLLIRNIFGVPQWVKDSLNAELYVKIGLVLLGASVIFGDVLEAGALGMAQALIVVVSVWYFSFWLCKKMKIDEEMGIMLSSAVSICGVSAAIATSGAIKGDHKKLSYVISLVLITAVPMMIFMPAIAEYLGLSQAVTGAWLGGSIDTTGAVAASGTMVGEEALKVSTIVKFSQNLLLGLAAFAISIYWSINTAAAKGHESEKPTLGIIWERFPKFVIGFLLASLLFSFVISTEDYNQVKGHLKSIQGLWFAVAFVSIGLETDFGDIFKFDNRKPLFAFLIAQFFNVIITLIVAYLLFR